MEKLPALSNLPIRPSVAAPLWRTVFGSGFTVGSVAFNHTYSLKKLITGTDTVTGFNTTTHLQAIFGSFIEFGLFLYGGIHGSTPCETLFVNDSTKTARWDADVTDTIGATTYSGGFAGGQELSIACDTRYTDGSYECNPQVSLIILAHDIADGLAAPVDELCIKLVFKLPTTLDLQDASGTTYGKYFVIYELKTGGDGGATSVGDLRVVIMIDGTSGVAQYQLKIDNVANSADAISTYYTFNATETVRLGVYTTMWLHFKRPASYTDITTGLLQCSIEPAGYGRITLMDTTVSGQGRTLDATKSCLMGDRNDPYTRFFANNYHRQETVDMPLPIIFAEYGFWRSPPFAIV